MQYIPIVAEPKTNTRGPQTTLLHKRRKEDFNTSIKLPYSVYKLWKGIAILIITIMKTINIHSFSSIYEKIYLSTELNGNLSGLESSDPTLVLWSKWEILFGIG